MAAFVPLNPRPMLLNLIGKPVSVRVKWGQHYTGQLVSADGYMNLQLTNAHEWTAEGADAGPLGQVLIRCNNVLWIKAADENEMKKEEEVNGKGE